MVIMLDMTLLIAALAMACTLQPWRLLGTPQRTRAAAPQDAAPLWTPLLATLVLLPWLWALPTLHQLPLQLPWSGAGLVLLCLGWPLAVPALCAVGTLAWLLSPALSATEALRLTVWQGLVPASLALLWGLLLRRWLGAHVFVYILGRGFVGTLLSLFAAALLAAALGKQLPGVQPALGHMARWLMAWGDAMVTGMLCAVFVAYRPQWLATWSDTLYLNAQK